MNNLSIYELKLHEVARVHDGALFIQALRVAGGWIYLSFDKSSQIMSQSFVPFNNEFMKGDTCQKEGCEG